MTKNKNVKLSKFLSLILRHNPGKIGIILDDYGWADVDDLLYKMNQTGTAIDFNLLKKVVDTNDKQRFTFNDDFTKIRANQGHSIDVNLQFESVEPPEVLYHGTAKHFLDGIKKHGLVSKSRQYVHLSVDKATAVKVGGRHGIPIVLTIRTGAMHHAGIEFYLSKNGVWLTDHVDVQFIIFSSNQ